jgi:hypothetical protein
MASAAVETSMAGNALHHMGGPSAEEPVFTSSDLPLQPHHHLTQHNDLFVNPAFAHMSFLSDGSMVGPMGELYCPAEYFPALQEVPAVIPVSPQPGEFPAGPPQGGSATPPSGVGKNTEKNGSTQRN